MCLRAGAIKEGKVNNFVLPRLAGSREGSEGALLASRELWGAAMPLTCQLREGTVLCKGPCCGGDRGLEGQGLGRTLPSSPSPPLKLVCFDQIEKEG